VRDDALEEATEEEDVQDNDRDDDDDEEEEEDDEGRYGVSEGQVVFLPSTIPGMSPNASPRRSNTISVSPYSPSPLPSSPSRWASARTRTMSAAGQSVPRSPYSSYAGGDEDVDVTPKASAFHPQRPSVVGSRRASATSSPTTATFGAGGGRPRSPSVAGSATMYSTLRGHQDLSPLVLSSLSGPRSGSPLPRSPTPSRSQYANNNHNMHLGLTGPMSPTTQNYHHHHYSTSNNSVSSNGTSNSNPVSLSHTSGSSPSSSPLPTPSGGEEGRGGPLTPSKNTFNLRRASQQCKSIPGYVSFAQVDGLGEPEDEEEPEAGAGADAGGVKRKIRKWAVSWFSQQQQQQQSGGAGEH
jgi:hypothetical protein